MSSRPRNDIPTFRIDLARPPELRYVDVAAAFGPTLRSLSHVFDEVLESILRFKWLVWVSKLAAKLFFRRVHDEEQTKEIQGLARASGVDLHLVVALNVLLDVLMGCTAGCVRVAPRNQFMHFRTLDWGVDALRELLVVLEFVDSSQDPEHVIATSVTYAGFVGVLTGVKENLSLSLNYRPIHHCQRSSLKKHQLLVMLGFRPSVSSVLRSIVLNPQDWMDTPSSRLDEQGQLVSIAERLLPIPSSPCYLTLSNGDEAVVIEKDLIKGRIKTSKQFIVQTNHDSDHSDCCLSKALAEEQPLIPHNELWLRDSTDRMAVIHTKWIGHCTENTSDAEKTLNEASRNGACRNDRSSSKSQEVELKPVSEEALRQWMQDEQISNSFTHFACIMDPALGTIRWLARGP